MSKRKLIACVLIVVVTAAAVLWLCWPEEAIGPGSFRRIRAGMTLDDVEAIIGLPPGDYHSGPHGPGGLMARGTIKYLREERGLPPQDIPESWNAAKPERRERCVKSWWANDHAIYVAFDDDGTAV